MEETKVLQLIPKEIIIDYIKGVKRGSYKVGFVDGFIGGGIFIAFMASGLGIVALIGWLGYEIYKYIKGGNGNGHKSVSGEQSGV